MSWSRTIAIYEKLPDGSLIRKGTFTPSRRGGSRWIAAEYYRRHPEDMETGRQGRLHFMSRMRGESGTEDSGVLLTMEPPENVEDISRIVADVKKLLE